MTREESVTFAHQWASAWNEMAVERVLAHFTEDVVFTSPTAAAIVGAGTLRGKEALRAYWTKALERHASLHFAVDRVVWDPTTRELAIIYLSHTAGGKRRVSENLTFGPDGLVVSAEVFHGVSE
jgi:ketosteroid isomerase-like protein